MNLLFRGPMFLAFTATLALGQLPAHRQVQELVDLHAPQYVEASKAIWGFAEMGYHEDKSSALLQSALKSAGFRIDAGVAGEPTAFVASYGTGQPVIGILGEFDALPGLSQAATPDRSPVVQGAPGHGCGHNLLGAGAALAAVAIKDYMEKNHVTGTLRYYGTPAEEGGSGKVYMLRAGLFRDVDVVLHWHPGSHNAVFGGALAIVSAKFRFHGTAAHAALAPDRGRSALDAVMLTGNGIEFLREHIPSTSRVHYVITNGGAAPNIVPDTAEMFLYARHPSLPALEGIWARITNIEQGAALMTETTADTTIISSDANVLPNDVLSKLAQKNLEAVGGFQYTADEQHFAEELRKSLPAGTDADLRYTSLVQPLRPIDPNEPSASTDVGDIAWNVPTVGFVTATFVPGVVPHTWQAAASAGMSIGQKGMVVASKALAITALDLFTDPRLVSDAKAEFKKRTTAAPYKSLIPSGQAPPLDYRRN